MAAEDLVMQEYRVSAATILTYFFLNITTSAVEVLKPFFHEDKFW